MQLMQAFEQRLGALMPCVPCYGLPPAVLTWSSGTSWLRARYEYEPSRLRTMRFRRPAAARPLRRAGQGYVPCLAGLVSVSLAATLNSHVAVGRLASLWAALRRRPGVGLQACMGAGLQRRLCRRPRRRPRTRELGHRLDAPQRLNHLVLAAAQPASALCL